MNSLRIVGGDHWHNRAACRDVPNANIFSPVEGSERRRRVNLPRAREVARTWCATCPVLTDCRADVAARRDRGLGPQELVEAGIYWPQANGRGKPIDLLGPGEPTEEAA